MLSALKRHSHSRFSEFPWNTNAYIRAIAVIITCLYITCAAISKSYLMGRLADPITHNDVDYFIDGIQRLIYIELNGFWAELVHLYRVPLHAPVAAYQAALGFYLFGFHDWAPYATDIIYLLIFASVCVWLLRGMPMLVVIAALLAIAGMPMSYTTISEFAPETPCGLFAAIGVILLIRINMLERALGARALAGLCFSLCLLGKPSSFVYMPLVLGATLGVAFIRDVMVPGRWRQFGTAVRFGILQALFALWLAALYMIPNFREFYDYFYLAMFDKANILAYGGSLNHFAHFDFYLTGVGAEYMFGNFMWEYVALVVVGMATALWRNDREFFLSQVSLIPIVIFMWLLPSIAVAKNTLFGMPFGYVLLFMVIMALTSIYKSTARGWAVVSVPILGFLLFVSGTSRTIVMNTPGFDWYLPGAHIIREEWHAAMDRFREVMLDNTPNYDDGSVYMTNVGYYHVPVLQYWFLKRDPFLNWRFASQWKDPDPQHHLEYINQNNMDYVIAAERDNGLTFGRNLGGEAAPAEDATLDAMWKDPNYAPIDQFYGPKGGTITVFQRRNAFAGCRPLGGFVTAGPMWVNNAPLSHVQAYSPEQIGARLVLDASGIPGQQIDMFFDGDHLDRLTFDTTGKASASIQISLIAGQNDVIFHYPASGELVAFKRLQILRDIKENE
jgi:hypothetical protein